MNIVARPNDHATVKLADLVVSVGSMATAPNVPALWRDLETRADASFFLSWDWIGCWLAQSEDAPFLLQARHGPKVVAMALLQPVQRRRHGFLVTRALMLHQTGDPEQDDITIEYNGILVDRAYASIAVRACLEFLIGHRRTRGGLDWDEMHLSGVPDADSLRAVAEEAGLSVWCRSSKPSWAVDLEAMSRDGQSYLGSLSANTRYQIRRAIRLYQSRGELRATPAQGLDQAMQYFEQMKNLHQRHWTARGFPGSFKHPFFERFHRALITECLPKGTVELVCVTVGDDPIGYLYNFIYNGVVYAYHTGFEYEDDAKLKPGLVSHYYCLSAHLQQGARQYNFLAGSDRYKASIAARVSDISYLVLQKPLLKLKIESVLRRTWHGLASFWPGAAIPLDGHGGSAPARSDNLPGPKHALADGRLKQGKVLVLGDDSRSFLTIVRSLGRKGIEVHAAPVDFRAPALRSRYIQQVHRLPYWTEGDAQWLEAMEALLRAEDFDLVIPCNEMTLLPIQRHRARLAKLTRLAMPDDAAFDVLFDKHNTRELARRLGVPVAEGRLPRPGETAQSVFDELGAPVVVKPRCSYTLETMPARGKVRILETPAELDRLLPAMRPESTFYEAFFPGHGVGVSVLAHRGKILQAFEHHRVRENTSGSYYRISAPLTPALEQSCDRIVAALGFTGVAMFEFRFGGAGHWILLEVNARPWGSMPLPVGLGIDFPYRWYTLLVDGLETPAVPYRPAVFGRNFVLDLWHTIGELKGRRAAGEGIVRVAAQRVMEFGRALTGREIHDVLVRDDLRPGGAELWRLGLEFLDRGVRRAPGRGVLARVQGRAALRRIFRGSSSPRSVIFVCQGNICRSPFAAALLRSRLSADGGAPSIASYGLLPMHGRPSPAEAIEAAAERGIDLRDHRSAFLSTEPAPGTVVIVFDAINRGALFDRYPDLRAPVLLLGAFAAAPVGDIADPYGGDAGVYAKAYDAIEKSIEGLVPWLATDKSMRPPSYTKTR